MFIILVLVFGVVCLLCACFDDWCSRLFASVGLGLVFSGWLRTCVTLVLLVCP